jgi:hypothetical protein
MFEFSSSTVVPEEVQLYITTGILQSRVSFAAKPVLALRVYSSTSVVVLHYPEYKTGVVYLRWKSVGLVLIPHSKKCLKTPYVQVEYVDIYQVKRPYDIKLEFYTQLISTGHICNL